MTANRVRRHHTGGSVRARTRLPTSHRSRCDAWSTVGHAVPHSHAPTSPAAGAPPLVQTDALPPPASALQELLHAPLPRAPPAPPRTPAKAAADDPPVPDPHPL